MRHPPENQPQEVLAGLVERVTYHNAENGFCVLRAKARGHRDVVTVVGHAATIAAGEWITASGDLCSSQRKLSHVGGHPLRTSRNRPFGQLSHHCPGEPASARGELRVRTSMEHAQR